MQYEIEGEYPSPSFFQINKDTGVLSLKKDLREDNLRLTSYTVSHTMITLIVKRIMIEIKIRITLLFHHDVCNDDIFL